MARETGDRYRCEKCNAEIVYQKGCPCPDDKEVHAEICCDMQMMKVTANQ